MSVLDYIGIVIGATVGVLFVFLSVVTFSPGFKVPRQPIKKAPRQAPHLDAPPPATRKDVRFEVNGTSISAWLYLPEDVTAPVPGIVMAHGLGGTKDFLLEPYAIRYTEAGYAVLTFDYRFFGASGGEPRQLLSIPHQLEDLAAAVAYARSLEEVDP
ncbi:MAG: alpha/beta hydrolase, partial [Candidatus Neomarinimicrobiota bacterium]